MTDESATPDDSAAIPEDQRRAALPAAAQRALAEADARRAAQAEDQHPVELGGRKGPEPVRYGDWEKKGIAIDF
ncbi:DUF1674 domain-containing protein [Roseinatronobacter thiooxidans]|uniref:DUF1674 domain-containing protein n=1 Tax=Roseinatronobacter thiooxidans TaxID=121821 RepID=UPI0008F836F5|nr:DUF1674 domain-containing protein [Roseinatronobacter thiooxidans]